jgi:ribosomal protein S18 acetylase RimI-like enzyme
MNQMPEIEIRPTISTDLARLSALDHTIETDYVWQLDLHREAAQVGVDLREVRLPRAVKLEHPRPAKELPDTWHIRPMLSAMLGMEAVAYIRFTDQIIPHAVWITDVVVGRPLRRQGLARKLIGAAEAWGVQRGLRRAIIEVQSKNQPAIRMILKMGFEFCGYNDQYYATRDVALFFVRSL